MHDNDPRHSRKHSRQLEWKHFFPAADHRWAMGLRRGNAAEFLAPSEVAEQVRAERCRWLKDDPHKYAALTPATEASLNETVELARSQGMEIDATISPWEKMLSLGRGWEADFMWLVADEGGVYRVEGGVVCFPSFWALQAKLGCTLSETHRPVPGLNTVLGRQIDTFLNKLVPTVAWLRENAGYSRSADRNQHPDRPRWPLDETLGLNEVWVRLEHQMLLKLPRSRSVLFSIRVEVVPLRQVLDSPQAAADLARLLVTMSREAAEYKGIATAREALVSFCRRKAELTFH